MRGVLSRRPALWTARLLVGAELLLVVTIVLLLRSRNAIDGAMILFAGALACLSALASLAAVIGDLRRDAPMHEVEDGAARARESRP